MYYNFIMTNDTAPPPTRAAGLVTVQLGVDLKRDWALWCSQRDLVPGKALRSLVKRCMTEGLELAASRSGEAVRVVVLKHLDRGPKVGREVYFTATENAAIEAVAKAQGFAFQEWVVASVRAALAKAPSYGQAELETLTQSNMHMAAVAVDLAALRRQEGAGAAAEALGRFEGEIRHHVETVSAAMAQGAQRWQLKV